jgi:streptomycin 6-kinase
MSLEEQRLEELTQNWDVSVVERLDETGIALVYRVARHDGSAAVLKLYKNGDPKNEHLGFQVMRHWNGHGAAELYQSTHDAILIEYLSGPSLGDLTRSGRDAETAPVLAQTAKALHRVPQETDLGLPTLETWYRDLLDFDVHLVAPDLKPLFEHTKILAKELFATQGPQIILHGDLHHDNVLHGDRGWLAIDPKGVIGEAEAEMANTYRNPKGGEGLITSRDRLLGMNAVFARELDLDPHRLLRWGAVKTALSAVWQIKAGLDTGPMPILLPMMLELQGQPLP